MRRLDGVLAIVQAGGQGSRLDVLTRERAKPALPYAGTHQLIDFTLSAVMNARIPDVWVAVQYLAASLDPHLAQGRPWDLDRTVGGYRRVVPEEGGAGPAHEGFATGNADHLHRIWPQILGHGPHTVVTMSADHVFNLDLRDVLDDHFASGAACTAVTAEVSREEARHKGVVSVARDGRVTAFADKPDRPATTRVATEIFVYDAEVLGEALARLRTDDGDGDTGLGDFGDRLLPALVAQGTVRAHALDGYWRDLGRPSAYLQGHRDLLRGRVDVFDHPERPIVTRHPPLPPARVRSGAVVADSLLSPGCDVLGSVRDSVLGPGVRVERGAHVRDSVLGEGVVVRAGAVVESSVVDSGSVVGRRAKVGRLHAGRLGDDSVTLVGRDCRVAAGVSVPAGARLDPGATA